VCTTMDDFRFTHSPLVMSPRARSHVVPLKRLMNAPACGTDPFAVPSASVEDAAEPQPARQLSTMTCLFAWAAAGAVVKSVAAMNAATITRSIDPNRFTAARLGSG
jgi:hypothetical protein